MATALPSTSARVVALALVFGAGCPSPTSPSAPDASPPPPVGTVAQDVDPQERRAVIGYFHQIEAIEGTPDKKARVETLMQDALAKDGDFTSLIAELSRIEAQIRLIEAPKSCQDFHLAKVKFTADTRAATEELHRAIAAKDRAAIDALGLRAPANEAELARLDAMRSDLLKRFGI